MSVISAGTTLTTALVQTGDTNGNLVFKTGSGGTTALTLGADQSATFAGAVSFGTSAFAAGSASSPSITFTGDTNTGIYSPGADTIAFSEGGVESMRIDSSGNVGIGRAPNYQLDVYRTGTTNTTVAAANDNIVNILQVSGNTAGVIGTITSHPLVFTAANTERMRITSTGNVGFGTSAPGAETRVTIRGMGTTSSTASLELANSAGNTRFYVRDDGTTSFYGASFSETVRIAGSGNVGIGLSSPSYRLDISDAGVSTTTTPTVRVGGARNMFFQPGLGGFGVYGPAIGLGAYINTSNSPSLLVMEAGRNMNGGAAIAGTGEGQIDFYAYNAGVYNTAVTVNLDSVLRARIDTNGNFLFNSGYGSATVAYGCRAWINFNGKNTPAIRASGNMSSITDDGTGQYRVNFTNAMPDVNFAVVASASDSTSYGGYHISSAIGNDSTGSARVWTGWTGGAADQGWVYIAIFR